MQAGFMRLPRELFTLREPDTIRRSQNPVEADLLGVCDSFQEERRQCWLTTRKQNDYLPARLERYRPVEDRLNVFERRLVHVADLVRIHEARIAHHVAAVRQVDR